MAFEGVSSASLRSRWISRWLVSAAYVLVVAVIAWHGAFRRPLCSWDALAYAGIVLSYESDDPEAIHRGAYAAMREVVTPSEYQALSEGSPYRAEVARDAGAFSEQLTFYRTRVVYVAASYLAHAAGLNVVRALLCVSALAYLALSVLVLFWMQRHLPPLAAAVVSALACTSGPFRQAARLAVPDGILALCVCAAIYLFLERKSVAGLYALLVLAVLVRHDAALVGFLFASALFLIRKREVRRSRVRHLAAAAGFVGAYALAGRLAGSYGWGVLFRHTFMDPLPHPATAAGAVAIRDYAHVLANSVLLELPAIALLPYLLVLAIGAAAYPQLLTRLASGEPRVVVPAVLLVHIVLRELSFPALQDRFYLAHYAVFTVVAISMARAPRPSGSG